MHSSKYHKHSVFTKESTKVIEILDAYGNLRYKVSLLTHDERDIYATKQHYTVQVINFFSCPEPLIVFERPDGVGEELTNLQEATEIYEECIRAYSNLVKAETRDLQDASIYEDKTGYKVTPPDCCATCKHCKKTKTPGDYVFGVTDTYECWHPCNANLGDKEFKVGHHGHYEHIHAHEHECWDGNPYHRPNCHDYDCDAHSHFHSCHEDMTYGMHPKVQPFGKCKHFEKMSAHHHYHPVPGDSICKVIDHKICHELHEKLPGILSSEIAEQLSSNVSAMIDNSISVQVNNSISTMLSTDIIPEVGRQIEKQLSVVEIVGQRDVHDYNNDGVENEEDFVYVGGGAA